MKLKTESRFKRRLIHHWTLALVSAIMLASIYLGLESDDATYKWSMGTGYVSLLLLGLTLAIGPINLLSNQRNPVSTDLRRDIGIWGAINALAHVATGLQVHMGNMLLYFFKEEGITKKLVLRSDLFGFANYTGLVSALILILLLALSNDLSLRKLKVRPWKYWHRWNYVSYILVIIHAIFYQVIAKWPFPFYIWLGVLILPVMVLQIAGYIKYKK